MTVQKPKSILKNIFGYDEFRLDQEAIIENVLEKQDTLAIMPTGGGKSLCYQIPALLFDGLTVVISPLISLMKDQVEQLDNLDIPAVFLNSTLSPAEYSKNYSRVQMRDVKLLYLAPETLFIDRTLNLLETVNVECITIDEAHCISEWGHDFRPEYRRISELISRFPKAVTLALTATATQRVRDDIAKTLNFKSNNQFISSFNRKNLFVSILEKKDAEEQCIDFVKKFKNQSGIIYCFSRKQVDRVYYILYKEGFSVKPYHAGLSETNRRNNQEAFIKDDVQIIVATIAFGMGINKPNVRFVLHFDLPKNIESYYQEIGRAGRDGLRADCCLLYSRSDMGKINYFIQQKEEKEQQIASRMLFALVDYVESYECRRRPLLSYFGEQFADDCGFCDNCINEKKEEVDMTIPAQKFLSSVKRSGERFGVNHIVEILRAANTQKIRKFDHQKLSTYGIGKDQSKEYWHDLAYKLIQKRFLIQDMEYGALKLNADSYALLKGEKKGLVAPFKEKEIYSSKKEIVDYDEGLFDLLRKRRKELADEQSVPPYVIFSDRSLREMAIYYPNDSDSLGQIHGVGRSKIKKYSVPFLEIINTYLSENSHLKIKEIIRKPLKVKPNKRMIEVGDRFNGGETIEHLKKLFDVKTQTIISHLYHYIQDGYTLNHTIHIPEDIDYKKIKPMFDKHGTEALKDSFNALDGSVSYEDLHFCRVVYLSELTS